MARRASKGLDPFGTAMLAIANQGMNVGIGDPEVRTLLVGTSEALGVYSLRCSPPAFELAPVARHPQVLAPHPTRQWRRDDRRGNRLGSEAMPQTVERGALGPSS
jgi:hypothetical protein